MTSLFIFFRPHPPPDLKSEKHQLIKKFWLKNLRTQQRASGGI